MQGKVEGFDLVACAFELKFHGGSMGYVVGERFTRAANRASVENIHLVCCSATGGVRMKEALISLMQMSEASAVIEGMSQKGMPHISVITGQTEVGVSIRLAVIGGRNMSG